MSISVVVPTLNRWAFLDECLASLAAQTLTGWEAIIVNDGSNEPDTMGIREKWSDSRFRWIDHPRPRGVSTARNAGINIARHPLVFTLDNDDMLYPRCLERLHAALEDPAVDCAYGDFEFFGSASHVHCFEDLELSRLAVTQFIPAQILMRKSLWARARGYAEDPCFLPGNEDWDFWLSAAECGFRYCHLRETLYRYRVHPGGMSKTNLARQDYRTRDGMYRRHRKFIDRHSSREEFVGSGYWRSASAFCRKGTILKSLALGLRAFAVRPDVLLARDLLRRNLMQALGNPS
ncbi:MAG: glycosyltransferase family 2 protein [Chthoniobacter sp.]|uniref:glycosyltransferase family 2 protein n=1 Tax=Chthoniobacter sp. TaxID=2510640 RepID=UPI0032A8F8CA